MKRTLIALGVLAVAASAQAAPPPSKPAPAAKVETRELTYQQDGTDLQGFVAWPAGAKGKLPGVLVVHEWWGHNQHARNQAIRLAEAGYVGFALDMYGKGKLATHPEDAQAFVAAVTKDPAVLMARYRAGMAALKADPHVDPAHTAAIGYCFGGAVVLAAARMGEPLDAVGVFHGMLSTDHPAAAGAIKARILVATGADDPMIPKEAVDAFRKEMDAAGAKYEVIVYPGAKHSFTNPEAGTHGMEGLAYNAEADQKSWEALRKTLHEAFGR